MINLAILFELQNNYDSELSIKRKCSESQNSLDILKKQYKQILDEKIDLEEKIHQLKIKLSDENFKLLSEETNLKKYNNELYTTHQSNPKYLRELETKIKDLSNLHEKEEELIIQLMDEMDSYQQKYKLINQQELDIKDALELKTTSHEALVRLSTDDLREIAMNKESMRNQIGEDVLTIFDKTFLHCQGKAVSTLVDGQCSVCRFIIPLTQTEQIKKNRNEIHYCSNCKRILLAL